MAAHLTDGCPLTLSSSPCGRGAMDATPLVTLGRENTNTFLNPGCEPLLSKLNSAASSSALCDSW